MATKKTTTPARRTPATSAAKKTAAKTTAAKETGTRKGAAEETGTVRLPTGDPPVATIATDAAFAPAAPSGGKRRPLRNMSEVRHFFRTNDEPIYFVGATPFNLLGLDRRVRNFTYVAYYDAGTVPTLGCSRPTTSRTSSSRAASRSTTGCCRTPRSARSSTVRTRRLRPKIAMVFFDEETEAICEELGHDLILPPAELRSRLDSKLVTTRLGNWATWWACPA